jgi:hypothetical protein
LLSKRIDVTMACVVTTTIVTIDTEVDGSQAFLEAKIPRTLRKRRRILGVIRIEIVVIGAEIGTIEEIDGIDGMKMKMKTIV